MENESHLKQKTILRILAGAGHPLGSTTIAAELQMIGIDLKQRMVRYYLKQMDENGLTENLGRAGRQITQKGIEELRMAEAIDRIGLISSKVDELAYKMSFDLSRRSGTVILNISRIRASDWSEAHRLIHLVLEAGLGMGKLIAVGQEGETFGGYRIPFGEIAVGTVCSFSLNGIFRAAGIPISSRFGGLLEIHDGKPSRFTHIIHYDATTIDPVEIFLKGKMTRVRETATRGTGTIGASFREIPAVALTAAEELIKRLTKIGLFSSFEILGRPGQPLLDIPVSQGRVGLIVPAGLNAIAAVEEAGFETDNHAMAALIDFNELIPTARLGDVLLTSRKLHKRISSMVESGQETREFGMFE